mgnify:CR=1 FL=1
MKAMTMTNNIIDLNAKRAPVTYTLTISHHWDGTIEIWVEGVTDSDRSQESVWYALKRFVDSKFKPENHESDDDETDTDDD